MENIVPSQAGGGAAVGDKAEPALPVGAGFGGRIARAASAVAASYRWALAMERRYDRLGRRGFRRDRVAFDTLMEGLDPEPRKAGREHVE